MSFKLDLVYQLLISVLLVAFVSILLKINNSLAIGVFIFTFFYIFIYFLTSFNLVNITFIFLLGIIFDSIVNTDLGISSFILIFLGLLLSIENRIFSSDSFFIKYLYFILNIVVLIIYLKVMSIFFTVSFINLPLFFIISLILYPIFFTIYKFSLAVFNATK